MIGVLPLTLFTEPSIEKVGPGKLEEDSRSCGDCKHVYSLRAAAKAVSLQKLLIYKDRQKWPMTKWAHRPSATKVSNIIEFTEHKV